MADNHTPLAKWLDKEIVARHIKDNPNVIYSCVRCFDALKAGEIKSMDPMELKDGLFNCPVHGSEWA